MALDFGGSRSSGLRFGVQEEEKKHGRGGISGFLGDILGPPAGLVGNLAGDVKDATLGLPLGLKEIATHPIRTTEDIASATWMTYSPLFHGHYGKFLRGVYDHPLAPLLDVATVYSVGASVATLGAASPASAALFGAKFAERAGALRTARAIKIADPTGLGRHDVTKVLSSRPGRRLIQEGMISLEPHLPKWTQASMQRMRYNSRFAVDLAHREFAKNQLVDQVLRRSRNLTETELTKPALDNFVVRPRKLVEIGTTKALPPVAPGHVRLFRGEAGPHDPNSGFAKGAAVGFGESGGQIPGGWFSPHLDEAQKAAKGYKQNGPSGPVYYIDLPEQEIKKYYRPEGGLSTGDPTPEAYYFPPEVRGQLGLAEQNVARGAQLGAFVAAGKVLNDPEMGIRAREELGADLFMNLWRHNEELEMDLSQARKFLHNNRHYNGIVSPAYIDRASARELRQLSRREEQLNSLRVQHADQAHSLDRVSQELDDLYYTMGRLYEDPSQLPHVEAIRRQAREHRERFERLRSRDVYPEEIGLKPGDPARRTAVGDAMAEAFAKKAGKEPSPQRARDLAENRQESRLLREMGRALSAGERTMKKADAAYMRTMHEMAATARRLERHKTQAREAQKIHTHVVSELGLVMGRRAELEGRSFAGYFRHVAESPENFEHFANNAGRVLTSKNWRLWAHATPTPERLRAEAKAVGRERGWFGGSAADTARARDLANADKAVAGAAEPDGGFTLMKDLTPDNTEGYPVAYGAYEHKVPAADFSRSDLLAYRRAHQDLLDENPRMRIGGWHNPEDGMIYLDISRVFKDEKAAMSFAKREGQDSIFSTATWESKKTGLSKVEQDAIKGRKRADSGRQVSPRPRSEAEIDAMPVNELRDLLDDAGVVVEPRVRLVPRHDATMLGREMGSSHAFIQWIWHKPTMVWKMLLLGYTPRIVTNNAVGNWFIAGVREGGPSMWLGLHDAYRIAKGVDEADTALMRSTAFKKNNWLYRHFSNEIGNVFGATLGDTIGKPPNKWRQGLYPLVTKTSETPVRMMVLSAFMRRQPEVQAMLKRGVPFNRAVERVLRKHPHIQNEASMWTRSIAGDYVTLRGPEKALREIMPFYLWNRHILRTTGNMFLDQPGRLVLMQRISNEGIDEAEKWLGALPDFLKSVIPLGPMKDGRGTGFLTGSLNPFATVGQLAEAGEGLTTGQGVRAQEGLLGQLHPFVTGTVEWATGQSLLTGAPKDRYGGLISSVMANTAMGLPQVKLLESLTSKDTSLTPSGSEKLYTADDLAAISSIFGIPIRDISASRAADLEEQLNGKKKRRRRSGLNFGGG